MVVPGSGAPQPLMMQSSIECSAKNFDGGNLTGCTLSFKIKAGDFNFKMMMS